MIMRLVVKTFLACALFLAPPAYADFVSAPIKTAEEMALACELLLRSDFSTLLPVDCSNNFQIGWRGTTKGWNLCALGKDDKLETKAFIFVSYVKDHPEEKRKPWDKVARLAFEKEWSCRKY